MRDGRQAIICNDFKALGRKGACLLKAHHCYSAKGKGGEKAQLITSITACVLPRQFLAPLFVWLSPNTEAKLASLAYVAQTAAKSTDQARVQTNNQVLLSPKVEAPQTCLRFWPSKWQP